MLSCQNRWSSAPRLNPCCQGGTLLSFNRPRLQPKLWEQKAQRRRESLVHRLGWSKWRTLGKRGSKDCSSRNLQVLPRMGDGSPWSWTLATPPTLPWGKTQCKNRIPCTALRGWSLSHEPCEPVGLLASALGPSLCAPCFRMRRSPF